MRQPQQDVVVIGGGHNGLVAATLLARAGRSVRVLERQPAFGGAAVSGRPFGVDARLSRFAYLVSLFPRELLAQLGVDVELRRRSVSSCTPDGDRALLVTTAEAATEASFAEVTGGTDEWARWRDWQRVVSRAAAAVAPTFLQPLRSADDLRAAMGDEAWHLLNGAPIGATLEQSFTNDLVRGVVLTDALIGTYARSDEPSLRQNRCFLYHVVGNGTGDWDVPVGGMGALTAQLEAAARAAGARLDAGVDVVGLDVDDAGAVVRTADGAEHFARAVVCAAAPTVLDRLLGLPPRASAPGSQVKVNMLLSRLPRLRSGVDPRLAFAGTLHLDERMSQLDKAFDVAATTIPDPLPAEVYCHTLTDPSILSPELAAAGVHTLTLFGLHAPAPLFEADPAGSKETATRLALASLQSVLDEPLDDCLLRDGDGRPCVEAHTPLDLDEHLGLPVGNIFHGDLSWPWAETDDEVGRWGVETAWPRVVVGGAGARRGGGVSGIGGHNAAQALLSGGLLG